MSRRSSARVPVLRLLPAAIVLTVGLTSALAAADLQGRVVGRGGSPAAAVVFLKGVDATPVHDRDTVITHVRGGQFEPRLSVGFVGNDYVLRNQEDTLHNTHLMMQLDYQKELSDRPLKNGATLYNIALPMANMEVRRPIRQYHAYRDDTGFIDVRCNPHPDEQAVVLVFDHPYATVTDDRGRFTLANVPAGRHEVWVWSDGKATKWGDIAGGSDDVVIELE